MLSMNPAGTARRIYRSSVALIVPLFLLVTAAYGEAPIKVFATLPDLGSIARSIGGDAVDVAVMVKGGEDPHFVEAKPSFIKLLSTTELLLINGMELEVGYLPLLLQNARNSKVLPGSPGYVDCSQAITPREVPAAVVDRSMGDVHPLGNPHYLTDPVNGVQVAELIRKKLVDLRPGLAPQFDAGLAAFRKQVSVAMVGEALALKYDALKLALLAEHGQLDSFLESQGDTAKLGGWFAALRRFHGVKFVDDHNLWPYFSARFGLDLMAHLEPKPGISPSTSHLGQVVARMKEKDVRLLVTSPYYDPRHIRFVAEHTGARIATLSPGTGAFPEAPEYVESIAHNVRAVVAALQGGDGG